MRIYDIKLDCLSKIQISFFISCNFCSLITWFTYANRCIVRKKV